MIYHSKYCSTCQTIADLADTIYGDIKDKYNDRDYITSHIMMSPKKETTEHINDCMRDGKCSKKL